jgi:hypothetical protein
VSRHAYIIAHLIVRVGFEDDSTLVHVYEDFSGFKRDAVGGEEEGGAVPAVGWRGRETFGFASRVGMR